MGAEWAKMTVWVLRSFVNGKAIRDLTEGLVSLEWDFGSGEGGADGSRDICRNMQVPLRDPGGLGQKAWRRGDAEAAWLGCPTCYLKGCFKDQDHVTLLLWACRCQQGRGLRAQLLSPRTP